MSASTSRRRGLPTESRRVASPSMTGTPAVTSCSMWKQNPTRSPRRTRPRPSVRAAFDSRWAMRSSPSRESRVSRSTAFAASISPESLRPCSSTALYRIRGTMAFLAWRPDRSRRTTRDTSARLVVPSSTRRIAILDERTEALGTREPGNFAGRRSARDGFVDLGVEPDELQQLRAGPRNPWYSQRPHPPGRYTAGASDPVSRPRILRSSGAGSPGARQCRHSLRTSRCPMMPMMLPAMTPGPTFRSPSGARWRRPRSWRAGVE